MKPGATVAVVGDGAVGLLGVLYSVLECVGTQESMWRAIHATRPGGSVSYVGVPHGVALACACRWTAAASPGGGATAASCSTRRRQAGSWPWRCARRATASR